MRGERHNLYTLTFPSALNHVPSPPTAASYWSGLGEPWKSTFFFRGRNSTLSFGGRNSTLSFEGRNSTLSFGGRNSTLCFFSNLSPRFRCVTSPVSPGLISIWDFYFDISEWHILSARAWTHALMLHLTNPCAKRKLLSLTKPKGKIYKTKSLGNYITLLLLLLFNIPSGLSAFFLLISTFKKWIYTQNIIDTISIYRSNSVK